MAAALSVVPPPVSTFSSSFSSTSTRPHRLVIVSCSFNNNNNISVNYPFNYKTRKFVYSTKTYSTNDIHNSSSIQPQQQDDDDDDDVIISDKVVEELSSSAADMVPDRWDVLGLGQAMVLTTLSFYHLIRKVDSNFNYNSNLRTYVEFIS